MPDICEEKTWTKWQPEKIFLKEIKNNQKVFFDRNYFSEKDFYIEQKKKKKDSEKQKNDKLAIEMIKKQSYKLGFDAGLLKDREKNILLENQINYLFVNFQHACNEFEKTLFSSLLKIILIVSSYVIGKKIHIKDDLVLIENIKKIIKKYSASVKNKKLFIHSDNNKLIKKIFKNSLNACQWELICDDHLDLNSFKIKSDNSNLDSTINARWQELYHLVTSEEY